MSVTPEQQDAEDALTMRHIAIDCDSELSAQGHGRPPSHREQLLALSRSCRNVYEGAEPLIDRVKKALAPSPASEGAGAGRLSDLVEEIDEQISSAVMCDTMSGGTADRLRARLEQMRELLAAQPKASPPPGGPTEEECIDAFREGRSQPLTDVIADLKGKLASPPPTPGEVEEVLSQLEADCADEDGCDFCECGPGKHHPNCHFSRLRAALSRGGGQKQPAPREIEEALLFLEADFLVRYGPDEILQCSRCDGFASPEEHDGPVRHKTGCPVCRRIATLRASTRQQWSQRVPDVPGHVRIWGIYWLPNASQWCEPFRLPRDLAIRSVSESHSTVWMFWHQPEVPELPPPPAAEPREGG